MALTAGRTEIVIALIDGPVAPDIAALPEDRIRKVAGSPSARCAVPGGAACEHGTFVAAMLAAARGSPAPAICPGCTLLVRPIFLEAMEQSQPMPYTTAEELAAAIVASIDEGARVINLSLALVSPSTRGAHDLQLALDFATQRGTIVVAAAGNEGVIGSSALTRHCWVIAVTGCDGWGAPLALSNFGGSIGRRGLAAPGANVTSLRSDGRPTLSGGTSVAVPFVSGAIALLWSEHPSATASEIKQAVLHPHAHRRPGIVPPLLDAWGSYEFMQATKQ
jgi:subtilisin family serine protease